MTEKTLEFSILGRVIGTYSGWDKAATFAIQVYDFKPLPGLALPEVDCITFDFETGLVTYFTGPEGEEVENNFDFIPRIIHLTSEFAP